MTATYDGREILWCSWRCQWPLRNGTYCGRKVASPGVCWQHRRMDERAKQDLAQKKDRP